MTGELEPPRTPVLMVTLSPHRLHRFKQGEISTAALTALVCAAHLLTHAVLEQTTV